MSAPIDFRRKIVKAVKETEDEDESSSDPESSFNESKEFHSSNKESDEKSSEDSEAEEVKSQVQHSKLLSVPKQHERSSFNSNHNPDVLNSVSRSGLHELFEEDGSPKKQDVSPMKEIV